MKGKKKQPTLMTVAEYAASIGKSSTHVYTLVKEKKVKHQKVGKITLIIK